jgi:FixJ family two-component response regulator
MHKAPGIGYSSPVVAVVDDDMAVRGSLKFSLEIEGFEVRTYANGDDLLGDANLAEFSCFIIDQRLPGMSGFDLVAAMRRQRIDGPVILITSQPTIILRERAAKAGIPIVEKPLLGTALLERVQAAIAVPPVVC